MTGGGANRYCLDMRLLVALALVLALAPSLQAKPYLRKPKRGVQMTMSEFTVQSGQDLEVCEYRRLPNQKPIDVIGFKLRMPAGAHHFVIWGYEGNVQDDSQFPPGVVESVACVGLAPDEFVPAPVIPLQSPNVRVRFPEGVALRLDPQRQVWLNAHLKNGEPAPTDVKVAFNLITTKNKKKIKHFAEAAIIGNIPAINIPAGGDQTITAEWTAPVNVNFIQLATHQHRLGTYANIEVVEPDGVTISRIYESTTWDHPPSLWPQPALRLEKGRKLRITCTWQNTDDHDVRFGYETTDEMCFILGFYYRDDGDTEPIGGTCVPAKRGLVCPFAPVVN